MQLSMISQISALLFLGAHVERVTVLTLHVSLSETL